LELCMGTYGRIDPAWFAQHLGHELIPRDEYGRCSDRCDQYAKCECCKTTKRCDLPLGHTGSHHGKQ
jgi:hypothetical protein